MIVRNNLPCQRCGSRELNYPACDIGQTVIVTCAGCGRYYGHYTKTMVKAPTKNKAKGDVDPNANQSNNALLW